LGLKINHSFMVFPVHLLKSKIWPFPGSPYRLFFMRTLTQNK
jgi:hypothetical protein